MRVAPGGDVVGSEVHRRVVDCSDPLFSTMFCVACVRSACAVHMLPAALATGGGVMRMPVWCVAAMRRRVVFVCVTACGVRGAFVNAAMHMIRPEFLMINSHVKKLIKKSKASAPAPYA